MKERTIDELCWTVTRFSESMLNVPGAYCLNARQEMQLVRYVGKLESENTRLRATLLEIARHFGIDDGPDLEDQVLDAVRRVVARLLYSALEVGE